MSSPTVIRSLTTSNHLVLVTTYFENESRRDGAPRQLRAVVQVYETFPNRRTSLQLSQPYHSEAGAIEHFNELVAGLPD